ncbi:MAG: ribonuclease III [Sedimentisphaerales bacterium]|nr:ribonuclease III [Sedimentisphaerales bacterium]
MDEEILQQVEQIIEYSFTNRNLLCEALTHSSSVDSRTLSNERMEFLGDSVLALVICRTLFDRSPDYLEGDLTKMKSMLVARGTCARIARELGLHKLLKVGKGMAGSQSLSYSLAAGLLEALIAAIYLDGGLEQAQNFILRNFNPIIQKADAEYVQGNFKSLLQQYSQQHLNATPAYELLDEKGPDHNKCFEAQAVINNRHFPSAWGTNKKEAEQKAALNALIELGAIDARQVEVTG